MDIVERIHAAADYINSRLDTAPTVGLILGSGLGDFADSLEDKIVIPYEDIPHFPRSGSCVPKMTKSQTKANIVFFFIESTSPFCSRR